MDRISVPDAGIVRAAAEIGLVKVLVLGPVFRYAGVRKSKILRVPSVEQLARISA
jgi:hypothetical protein